MERTCKRELVKMIAERRGMTQVEVACVVNDLFEYIKDEVGSGRRVAIANFGVFRLHTTPARKEYLCPATGLRQDIRERKSLRFKQSVGVRENLNMEG